MAKFNLANARQVLAHYRDETLPEFPEKLTQTYDPVLVKELGTTIINQYQGSISKLEYFAIYEQTLISHIDTGDNEKAQELLDFLISKFPPEYSRVKKLRGHLYEAQGRFQEAIRLYDECLEQNQTNMPIHKRKIMAYVSMGDTQKAIELLVSYLDTFMQDTEAWVTLGNLYLQTNAFQQALFCYEELVLLRPAAHLYLLKVADLYCAVGKHEIGKKYYLGVVQSLADCLHGWYGVYYCCKNLKQDGDLFDLAKSRILELAKGPTIQKVYK